MFGFHVQTMGTVRVPLFTMGDGKRGFPAFIANQFAGNAKFQLLHGLKLSKLLTEEDINASVNIMKQK